MPDKSGALPEPATRSLIHFPNAACAANEFRELNVQSYRLVFADDGIGVARRVEFEAEDAAHALVFAHREAKKRSAELWQGERRLCTIARPAAEPQPTFLPPQGWGEQVAA